MVVRELSSKTVARSDPGSAAAMVAMVRMAIALRRVRLAVPDPAAEAVLRPSKFREREARGAPVALAERGEMVALAAEAEEAEAGEEAVRVVPTTSMRTGASMATAAKAVPAVQAAAVVSAVVTVPPGNQVCQVAGVSSVSLAPLLREFLSVAAVARRAPAVVGRHLVLGSSWRAVAGSS